MRTKRRKKEEIENHRFMPELKPACPPQRAGSRRLRPPKEHVTVAELPFFNPARKMAMPTL
ncbi:MAG TPA: hypothetical protein VGR81_13660 [Candidatus Acidoferrales bacterium]|nr:hypothetical protein [Candidatus Acidoferrales bacterium]